MSPCVKIINYNCQSYLKKEADWNEIICFYANCINPSVNYFTEHSVFALYHSVHSLNREHIWFVELIPKAISKDELLS